MVNTFLGLAGGAPGSYTVRNLTVTGTFQSRGIDDQATSTQVTVTDSGTTFRGSIIGETSGGETNLILNNTGSGDSAIRFRLGGLTKAIIGIDNSDGDKIKIAPANLGTSDWLIIDPSDGSTTFAGDIEGATSIRPNSYTVGTVPSASGKGAGAQIYVTDETGGATGAESDGTNWRRYADRAIIS